MRDSVVADGACVVLGAFGGTGRFRTVVSGTNPRPVVRAVLSQSEKR